MRTQDTLAQAIAVSQLNLTRYLIGFDDSTHTRTAPALPNHVAWSLGHISLTMHRVSERLDKAPIPPSDFTPGAAIEGSATNAYAVDSIAFGSKPVDDVSMYPPFARCLEIFNNSCARLQAAARAADEPTLATLTPWGGSEIPFHDLILRMAFHNGMHCGQIADLRRALRFKSIFA